MIEVYDHNNINYDANGDMTLSPTSLRGKIELNGICEIVLEHPFDEEGRWKYLVGDNVVACPTPWSDKQLFRIYNTVKGMTGITVNARHIYFDLENDILLDVRPTLKNAQEALDIMLANTAFTGHSNISTINTAYYIRKNVIEALASDDDNSFINRWGGERHLDNYELTINDKIGGDYGVRAEFGYNLADIEEDVDFHSVVTRIIPVGANGIMMGGDEPWVDSVNINKYANIKTRIIEFDDVKVKEDDTDEEGFSTLALARLELRRRCNLLFKEGIDTPSVNYNVDMVNLALTTEYKGYEILEEVRLGDTVHCKHGDLEVDILARCISQEWEVEENGIKYTNLELGNFKQNYFDKQSDVTNRVSKILNNNGTVNALSIEGTLNALQTKFKAMKDIAQTQHVRAMLFEDLDVNSPTFGAMCIGTMGFEISNKRNATNTDWVFRTFGTGKGFDAGEITAGILKAVLIQNMDGSFKIDLSSTGGANYYSSGKKAMEMRGNKIDFFNWGIEGDYIGSIGSVTRAEDVTKAYISMWNDLDSALSLGYRKSGDGYFVSPYIRFDKYNVFDSSHRPIRIFEGVEFSAEASHFGEILMNNYPIRLNASGTSHINSMTIGGTDPAVEIGNSLWVNNNIYASGVKLNGADYSEYFEWLDGNAEDEDRVGYIVALSGDKIIKATGDDVLGIISATPSIIGDTAHDGWQGKYLTDKWGLNIYETIEATYDEDGNILTPEHTSREKILNPHYDEDLEYIPRSNRREWGVVGLLGKLICRDDNTSSVGDYVTSIDGIASKSNIKTRMRVMKRIDANTIKVFVM